MILPSGRARSSSRTERVSSTPILSVPPRRVRSGTVSDSKVARATLGLAEF